MDRCSGSISLAHGHPISKKDLSRPRGCHSFFAGLGRGCFLPETEDFRWGWKRIVVGHNFEWSKNIQKWWCWWCTFTIIYISWDFMLKKTCSNSPQLSSPRHHRLLPLPGRPPRSPRGEQKRPRVPRGPRVLNGWGLTSHGEVFFWGFIWFNIFQYDFPGDFRGISWDIVGYHQLHNDTMHTLLKWQFYYRESENHPSEMEVPYFQRVSLGFCRV